jgi:hypothetical protein
MAVALHQGEEIVEGGGPLGLETVVLVGLPRISGHGCSF